MGNEPIEGYFEIRPDPDHDFNTAEELAEKAKAAIERMLADHLALGSAKIELLLSDYLAEKAKVAFDRILEDRLRLGDPKVEWLLGAYLPDMIALGTAASEMLTDVDDGDITFQEYLTNFQSLLGTLLVRAFKDGRNDAGLNGWRDQL